MGRVQESFSDQHSFALISPVTPAVFLKRSTLKQSPSFSLHLSTQNRIQGTDGLALGERLKLGVMDRSGMSLFLLPQSSNPRAEDKEGGGTKGSR